MTELIATIILIGSLLGMILLFIRKIPLLAEISEIVENPRENFWLRFKNKITNLRFLKFFSFEKFLQKTLYKIKILTLKTENKITAWLQRLKENSQNKKLGDDNYWQKLKKVKKEK